MRESDPNKMDGGIAELSLPQSLLESKTENDKTMLETFLLRALPLMVNARIYGVRNINHHGNLRQEWFHRASGKTLVALSIMSLSGLYKNDPVQVHRDNNLKILSDTEVFAPRTFRMHSEHGKDMDRVVHNVHHYMRNKYNKIGGYEAYSFDYVSNDGDHIFGRYYNPYGTRLYLRVLMAESSQPYPRILDSLADLNIFRSKRFADREKRLAL